MEARWKALLHRADEPSPGPCCFCRYDDQASRQLLDKAKFASVALIIGGASHLIANKLCWKRRYHVQCTLAEIKKMSLRRFALCCLSRILVQLASSAVLLHELVCVL